MSAYDLTKPLLPQMAKTLRDERASKTPFYVMHCVDGDECLIAAFAHFADAIVRMCAESKRDARADVSVCHVKRGIFALVNGRGGWGFTPAGLAFIAETTKREAIAAL